MGKFGWSYPAGAENDPNAPYNQEDPPEVCPICDEPNANEDGEPLYDGVFCSQRCEEIYSDRVISDQLIDNEY